MAIDSIPARLLAQGKAQGDRPAYFVRNEGGWTPTSWSTFSDQVQQAAKAQIALGLEHGGTVCILGFNRPEWVVFDLAAMMAGGAPAGIYTTCSANEVQYIIGHAKASLVLLENAEQWAKVNAERERLPNLKHVIMMADSEAIDDPMVMTWNEFIAKGHDVTDESLNARMEALEPDQLATLIYTSGTTGPPKAVMLSHHNLTWTADVAKQLVSMTSDDCSVSYLPLSHIAEQMFSIHGPVVNGSSIYFAESLERLPDNLKEVRPTVMFGVPRIWEKFHAGVSAKLNAATGIKGKLARWALKVGREVNAGRLAGKEPSGFLGLKYKLANKLIFAKVKGALGLDRIRVAVSGAAPIAAEVLEFFTGLDIIIYEVYGQSEDCGPTSFNVPGQTRFGTVGPVLPGVDVKIADDGEILVKGPNVFMGYLHDKEATDAALIDGWLYSGDLGAFDKDGFLTITGRKKDIIITAGGKNITPVNIEGALKNHELISEAVVIGDRRKFLSALVTLDDDALTRFCESNGIKTQEPHKDPAIQQEVEKCVEAVNKLFARVENVRKFHILHRNLTIDDGELTPTLKVKRNVVYEHFSNEIDSMYA
jgi:long-chain acyl-CoA synthetase